MKNRAKRREIGIDAYYTQEGVARELTLQFEASRPPAIVADFAVGSGSLIAAAQERWRRAKFVGTDIDGSCIRKLRYSNPTWNLGKCDFLSTISRRRCKALVGLEGKVSLCLLNPPFSCRGASYIAVDSGRINVRCSTGLAFVITALPFLSEEGRLLCFLPAGSVHSQRDSKAWTEIGRHYKCGIVKRVNRKDFVGVSAKILVMEITPRKNTDAAAATATDIDVAYSELLVRIVRGSLSTGYAASQVSKGGVPFIHTTNLSNGKIERGLRIRSGTNRLIEGPAVLLPRVGQPSRSKTAILRSGATAILSDCVFAIRCESNVAARVVSKKINLHWGIIESSYGGTGAPYLTIERLQRCLARLGVGSSVEYAESTHSVLANTREMMG